MNLIEHIIGRLSLYARRGIDCGLIFVNADDLKELLHEELKEYGASVFGSVQIHGPRGVVELFPSELVGRGEVAPVVAAEEYK